MHKGHLLELNIIIAFSIEKLSEGNPSIFHDLIFTGSPSTFSREYFAEPGIYFSSDLLAQSSEMAVLYAGVNAPKYAINPEDTKTSPVKFT